MPIVRSIIESRNNFLNSILCIFAGLALFVLYCNNEVFTQVINIKDLSSLFLLCFGMLTVIVLTSFIHLLLIYVYDYFLGNRTNILSRLWKQLQNHEYIWYFVVPNILGLIYLIYLYLYKGLQFDWSYFLVIISASILFEFMILWAGYDDFELASTQHMEQSIGACWAYGAYTTFYKKILFDITSRMSEFEEKHKISLLIKKLILICPLSCNATGSLEGKDGNIKAFGNLRPMKEDDGANNDREFKTSVYRIHKSSELYVAAEIPSPLATLHEMRDVMDNVILQYHRECFIETLRTLLKSDQCIILEYDDLNSPEPLHSFLLSKLGG